MIYLKEFFTRKTMKQYIFKTFTNITSILCFMALTIPLIPTSLFSVQNEAISFKCNRIFESRKSELVELLDTIKDEKQAIKSVNEASRTILNKKSQSLDKRKNLLDKQEKILNVKLARLNRNIQTNNNILKQITNKLLTKLSTAFTKMSPAKAAGILDKMEDGEASSLLFLLKPKVMSNILSKMKPKKSASVTLLIKQGPPFRKNIKTYAIKKPNLIEKAIEEDFK